MILFADRYHSNHESFDGNLILFSPSYKKIAL